MKILHVAPGLNEKWNGIAVAAKLIAREHGGELIDCSECLIDRLRGGGYDEVWVHSMWLPQTMLACWRIIRLFVCLDRSIEKRPKLVRMIHGNLDPVRLGYHGWRKRLVTPIERWLLRRSDRIVATCEAEKRWIEAYEPRVKRVEMMELKRFFRLEGRGNAIGENCFCASLTSGKDSPLHVLYVGRRHPLKGVEFLEKAVDEVNTIIEQSEHLNIRTIDLRIVSDHFGEELERDWAWCDVLCLPTLSENFGLVVAEALERGKRVVTTDGAPAWGEGELFECSDCSNVRIGYGGRLVYLKGYRDGTDAERVRLLKEAIGILV